MKKQKTAAPMIFGASLGLFSTLVQVVLLREFLVIRGANELSLGIVLCHWLVFIAIGALAAPKMRPTANLIQVAIALCALLIPAALLFARHYENWFALEPGAFLSISQFFLLSVLTVAPCAFFVGFFFAATAFIVGKKRIFPVTALYTAEAVGATVGGLLFSFLLSPAVSPIFTLLLALFFLALGAQSIIETHRLAVHLILPIGLIVLLIVVWLGRLDQRSQEAAFHAKPSRGTLVECKDTKQARICIGENQEQFQLYRDGQLDYTFPDPYERPIAVHVALSFHPSPSALLIIGGGTPNRMKVAQLHSVDDAYYLYQDKLEYSFLQPYLKKLSENGEQIAISPTTSSPDHLTRFHLYHQSPRPFLRDYVQKFDVVLCMLPQPFSAAQNSLHTIQFFQAVQKALKKGGVLVIGTPGSANVMSAPAAALLANQRATLKEVFSTVRFYSGVQSFFVATNASAILRTANEIEQRLLHRNPSLQYAYNYADLLSPLRNQHTSKMLQNVSVEINRDGQPNTFLHSFALRRLAKESSIESSSLVNILPNAGLLAASILIPAIFILLFIFWGKKAPKPTLDATLDTTRGRATVGENMIAIATTGLCGMGLQIILLYLFAAKIGGLYHHLAWLVAGFMSGLGMGAFVGGRLPEGLLTRLAADIAVVVLLGFCPIILMLEPPPIWLFVLLVVCCGWVTGIAFPIFMAAQARHNLLHAPAAIEAADHLGAALGAIATALVWLPHWGVTWTCVLLLSFKVPLIVKNIGKIVRLRYE